MPPEDSLPAYFQLQRTYSDLYAAYQSRGIIRQLDPADKEMTANAEWKSQHYFNAGRDALRIVLSALVANLREPPRSILDFPSGSGRVTRHLRAFFPHAEITACDLYDYHVDFCRRVLGVEGRLSRENIGELDFGQTFDLIFCGSLLTHLPEALCRDTMQLFGRSLSDRGIAVVTLHGRFSEHIQKHEWKYIDDQLFDVAARAVGETGFGYVDYDHDFKRVFDRQSRYGITLVRPHWILRQFEPETGLRILGYAERDWDDHQDVFVFGKPGVNTARYA